MCTWPRWAITAANNQTMALLPGSAAVGTGEAVAGITTDERGEPVTNPPCMGAYQVGKVASIVFTPETTTPTADTPFRLVVTAEDVLGNPVLDASFPVTLTSNNGPISPGTVLLVNGVWTGNVTLHDPGSFPENDIHEGNRLPTRGGGAGSVAGGFHRHRRPGGADDYHIEYHRTAPITGVPETAGQPFTVTVSAEDAAGVAPVGYTGPFSLTAAGCTFQVRGGEQQQLHHYEKRRVDRQSRARYGRRSFQPYGQPARPRARGPPV